MLRKRLEDEQSHSRAAVALHHKEVAKLKDDIEKERQVHQKGRMELVSGAQSHSCPNMSSA